MEAEESFMARISVLALVVLMGLQMGAASVQTVPYKVAAAMPDAAILLSPAEVQLEAFLGQRIAKNEKNRLLKVDEHVLLGGFQQRPGSHPWIGEHIGKFLHAATLAWVHSGDAELKAKIDRLVAGLIQCQEPDGYLGTYLPKDRWTSWDVWSHKYNLIGLLTYYQYTGDEASLNACRKMGDLLIRTFPSQKSILQAGEHVGMAATSVLEPIVILYRFTGDPKYLDFAKYIVGSYDEPGGPGIVKTLTEVKRVDKTANGKAYEMMSNLVGLCELARATGDRKYLVPAVHAWEDIVANHLYITGSLSQGEHFHEPHKLPNAPGANVAETCATVTWLQLNAQLLRLTGDAKYGDELERTFYNHLAAAQRPDGEQWCYFTALQGTKPYGPGTNCCVSSGPRGMAMIPQLAAFRYQVDGKEGLAINVLEDGRISTGLGGQQVTVALDTSGDPREGKMFAKAVFSFTMDKPATFGFKMRTPKWAQNLAVHVEGEQAEVKSSNGWAMVPPRQWTSDDQVVATFEMVGQIVAGQHTNQGYNAAVCGPLVLAYDEKVGGMGAPAGIVLPGGDRGIPSVGAAAMTFDVPIRTMKDAQAKMATFVPFADAGAQGGRYQVWLRDENNRAAMSLLMDGKENRSRQGNVSGRISDGDPGSFVVTFDGKAAEEDWYAVALDAPVAVKRIVYAHGSTFHDGGWFDASSGKPRIQVRRETEGAWENVGVLDAYPDTTAKDSRGLRNGQEFTLVLKEAMQVRAIRIVGKPASGDNDAQAFSSCGELQAFAD